jgi:hypothetical protein
MPSVPSAVQLLLPWEQTKRCPRCGETKALEAFALALRCKGHRASWCRACQAEYRRTAQPPRRRQTDPEVRARNNRQVRERAARKQRGEPTLPRKLTAEVYAPPPPKNPKRLRHVAQRKRWLWVTYGLTVERYEALRAAQHNLCAICRQPEIRRHPKGGEWQLSVDHCHETGEIRGLLCEACNNGLGKFHDDPDLIEKAAAYLRKHRT